VLKKFLSVSTWSVLLILWVVTLVFDPFYIAARNFLLPKLLLFYFGMWGVVSGLLLLPSLESSLPQVRQLPKNLFALSGVWLGWLIITALFGEYGTQSWFGSYGWQLGVSTQIALWGFALMAFLAITENTVPIFWRGLVLGSVPILIYGTLQYFQLEPISWKRWGDAGPVTATLGNENYLGAYLTLVLPLTLMLVLNSAHASQRLGWGGLFVWQLIILGLTNSVGSWIATTVVLSLTLWWRWRFKVWQAIASLAFMLCLSLGGTLFVAGQGDAIGEMLRGQGITREIRPFTWATAFAAVAARPWLGWGSSAFEFTQARYASPKFREYIFPMDRMMDRTHNLWLEVAVETGVLGLGLWLMLAIIVGVTLLRAIPNLTPELRYFVLSGVAALFGYVLSQIVNPSDLGTSVVFSSLLGTMLGVTFSRSAETKVLMNVTYWRFVLLALWLVSLAGWLYAAWLWWVKGF
jgi:O-antigen ligase